VSCYIEGGDRLGRLAIIWNNDVNLHILSHNRMLIDFYVLACLNNDKWLVIGLYGHPTHDKKYLTCDTIMRLYNSKLNDK